MLETLKNMVRDKFSIKTKLCLAGALGIILGIGIGWAVFHKQPLVVQQVVGQQYGPMRMVWIESQARQLPANGATVFLGDSLTDGLLLPDNQGDMLNAGVAGARVADALTLAKRLLDSLKPATVIVTIGVNDTSRSQFDAVAFRDNYLELCDTIEGVGSKLIISTLLPIEKDKQFGKYFNQERIIECNNIIRSIASTKSIELLDAFAYFADSEGYMPKDMTVDGVHLAAQTYVLWKQLMLQKLGM
ncbi:MAG: GDSL-type esterase/lipase family protein [Planctomycetota bacterium]|jgi:lysophospholipase L1-like esterase|nr:GDSL-type esterase/lipase family protein [Planctomycetota bacterium]